MTLTPTPQLSAFLRVIRQGESSQTDQAYYMINGGGLLPDLSKHPWYGIPTTQGAKACGAYQFLGTTWAGLANQYGFTDFSEQAQDEGAVALIKERGADVPIESGDLVSACTLLHSTWTSLPGGSEQNQKMDSVRSVFARYGGVTSQPVTAVPAASKETPMGALALLPLIAQFIPQIMTLIKPGSVTTAKDAAVAQTVLNTVVQAAGIVTDGSPATAATVGAAADKMAADPALAKQVQQAVVTEPSIIELLEIGGGVAAARTADLAQQTASQPFYKTSAVFYVSLLLLPMIYLYVWSSIAGGVIIPDTWPWYAQFPLKLLGVSWDPGARVGLANLIVGLVLGGICGVYFGVSVTQSKQQQSSSDKSG